MKPERRILDAHLHVLTEATCRLANKLYSRGNGALLELNEEHQSRRRMEADIIHLPEDPVRAAAYWKEELRRNEVCKALLLPLSPNTREHVYDVCASAEGTLLPLSCLNPLQTWSASDLEKEHSSHGVRGLVLYPALQHFHPYDRRSYSLYEVCGKLRLPVVLDYAQDARMLFFDLRYSNPIDLHPVARDFPEVDFLLIFNGAFLREILLLGHACSNVHLIVSDPREWPRFEPSSADAVHLLERIAAIFGWKRLIYGSNSSARGAGYAAQVMEHLTGTAEKAGAGEEELAGLLGGNLERLLSR